MYVSRLSGGMDLSYAGSCVCGRVTPRVSQLVMMPTAFGQVQTMRGTGNGTAALHAYVHGLGGE